MPNWKKVIVSGSDAILGAISADSLTVAGSAIGAPFPFIGDARITGSLLLSGSLQLDYNGEGNIIIGSGSGGSLITGGTNNIIFGNIAATSLTTGDNNLILGTEAGNSTNLNNESQNTIIGNLAGKDATYGGNFDGGDNTFVGYQTGRNSAAQYCTFVGSGVGMGVTKYSVGMGANGTLSCNAEHSTAIGYNTQIGGANNYNVSLGTSALRSSNGGSVNEYNVALGFQAQFTSYRNNNTISIGAKAAYGASYTKDDIFIGYESAYSYAGNTTGRNLVIGYQAGYDLGDASTNNILIGEGVGAENVVLEKQLKIGSGSLITISGSLATGDVIFYNTASAPNFSGSFQGDGSQLTGISAGTNLTQSIFVSPSGNDGTAVVGDLMKPFSTILGATGSANIGDTIIVYPGSYVENHNLYKNGINYHFIDGAIVESTNPVEPMWGGGGGAANSIEYFSSPVSITGHGEFINTSNTVRTGTIFYLGAPSGIIEFKKAFRAGIGGTSYATVANFAQQRTADAHGVLTVKGEIENSGSGGNLGQVVGFIDGNINAELIVRQHKAAGTAVKIWGSNCDLNATMDVYSEGMAVDVAQRTSALTVLKGRYETLTSNQGTYYCIDAGYNSRGNTLIDAEVRGAIAIEHGDQYEGSTTIMGYQEVSASPGGAACVIVSGFNQLSQKIYTGVDAFKVTGGTTTFDGTVRLQGYNAQHFNISAGKFYFKGTTAVTTNGYPTTRTDPSVISGGELIIESQFDVHSEPASVANEYIFNLSGGVLDIRNKVVNHVAQSNNGIINMTGGYLKLNSAELVHATKTGSFAYAIDLNGQNHSGSILNNSFTNLQPFNSGSFTNEVVGGGSLFESHKLF